MNYQIVDFKTIGEVVVLGKCYQVLSGVIDRVISVVVKHWVVKHLVFTSGVKLAEAKRNGNRRSHGYVIVDMGYAGYDPGSQTFYWICGLLWG